MKKTSKAAISVAALVLLLAFCSQDADETPAPEAKETTLATSGEAITPEIKPEPDPLWSASGGAQQIVCDDPDGIYTARFTLPPNNDDPLVAEMQEVLAQVGETEWSVLVVEVHQNTWTNVNEDDYFGSLHLVTPEGELELTSSRDTPDEVLGEAGLLSPYEEYGDLSRQARELRVEMYRRRSEDPEVHYLVFQQELSEVFSAKASFPWGGKPCTTS